MNNPEDRKAELEKKKQKLAELRKLREKRKNLLIETHQKDLQNAGSPTQSRREIEDLVAALMGERGPGTPMSETPASDAGSEIGSTTPSTATLTSSGKYAGYMPELTVSRNVLLDIAPAEQVVYNKEVQTVEGSFDEPQLTEEEIRAQIIKEMEDKEKAKEAALEEERRIAEEEAKLLKEIRKLSEEEKKAIITDHEFMVFIDVKSKIVERALNEYESYDEDPSVDDEENAGRRIKLLCSFFDDKWSKNRSVTDVAWSKRYPELLVSSYNKNPMAVSDPDGVACIWNLHLRERPEFVFHSQSDVLSVMFSNFHPNYVIGGTYSGQIVLWDTRAKSLPVLKTPLSSGGHAHPVYSLMMVGTQNAHNIISASTDGLVCSWQPDVLTQPVELLELTQPKTQTTAQNTPSNTPDEIAVTCLGFPDNETTTFWVGTEEGNMYQANRHNRANSKAGINQYDIYKGHAGMITGLNFHPLFGSVDFSDLVLTSSVDWTIKLWRSKSLGKASSQQTVISPLYSFEQSEDYVYDVKWSPTHPALFASVDGSGKFDLWDLNVDKEVPVVSTLVGSGKALNKLSWDKEGKTICVGSGDGQVYVYDIGEMSRPKSDTWNLLQRNITEMISDQEAASKLL